MPLVFYVFYGINRSNSAASFSFRPVASITIYFVFHSHTNRYAWMINFNKEIFYLWEVFIALWWCHNFVLRTTSKYIQAMLKTHLPNYCFNFFLVSPVECTQSNSKWLGIVYWYARFDWNLKQNNYLLNPSGSTFALNPHELPMNLSKIDRLAFLFSWF